MHPTIRQTGRWVIRNGLWLRLALSRRQKRAYYNSRLNWREFWQERTQLLSYPRHIQVGTNLTCNLQCVFCRRQHPAESQRLNQIPPNQKEISQSLIIKLLQIAPYAEIVNVTPYGEPLLFSRLPDFLKRYQHLGCRNLALTTNGCLIDDKMAELLVRSGLNILFFSIDSVDPQNYRLLRVGAELERVEAGIELVNKWKAQLRTQVPQLILAATFMRRNIEELPQMIDFCQRHKFSEISVQMMEVEIPELEPESLKHHIKLTRNMLNLAEVKAKAAGIKFTVHRALINLLSEAKGTSATIEKKDSVIAFPPRLVDLCNFPWYFIYIDTNGDVRPCCYASVCWGNLNEQPFKDIWNGTAAIKMRQMFLNNVIPRACQNKHCLIDQIIPEKE